jgi:hypothetical protein
VPSHRSYSPGWTDDDMACSGGEYNGSSKLSSIEVGCMDTMGDNWASSVSNQSEGEMEA